MKGPMFSLHQHIICIELLLSKHTHTHLFILQTMLIGWMLMVISVLLFPGATAGRSGGAVPTEEQPPPHRSHLSTKTSVCALVHTGPNSLLFIDLCVQKCDYPCFFFFVFALVHVCPHSLILLSGASFRKNNLRIKFHLKKKEKV